MHQLTHGAAQTDLDPQAELATKKDAVCRIVDLAAKQESKSFQEGKSHFFVGLLSFVGFAWMGFNLATRLSIEDSGLASVIPTLYAVSVPAAFMFYALIAPLAFSSLTVAMYQAICSALRPHPAQIFALLAQYDPINKQAYQHLQQETGKAGRLKEKNVTAWAEAETDALHRGLLGPEADDFLNKKV